MSSPSHNRIVAAIRGAFVADAASMGTHWIYDPAKMLDAVPSMEEPEFKAPPNPSYYTASEFPGHYGSGMLSPYGEQLLFVTEYSAAELEIDGPKMSDAMLVWAESFGGRPDHAISEFIKNKKEGKGYPDCGADDEQGECLQLAGARLTLLPLDSAFTLTNIIACCVAHCYMKVVPVTCLYAGKPELAAKVEEAIRVHQNNDVAVAFGVAASCMLEAVLLGSSLSEALEICAASSTKASIVAEALAKSKEAAGSLSLEELLVKTSNEIMKDNPDSPSYNLAARSCKLPGSFIVPLHQLFVAANASGEEVYTTAIRNNILGAGDTCSRAVIIGAILAAATGGPPDSWVAKMDADTLAKVDAAAEAIATHAVSTGPASI